MSPARSSTSLAAAEALGPFAGALTAEEFSAFAAALAARQRRAIERRIGALALGGGALAAFALAGLFLAGVLKAGAAALFIAILAGGGVAHVYFRRQIARAQAASIAETRAERPVWATPRRITLDPAGVLVETGRDAETTPWARFVDVERIGPALALWTAAGGLALPMRALGEAAAEVERAARGWIAAARADGERST